MSVEPETRYASADGTHIAYQVVGQPPPHLLMVPGLYSHLDMQWRLPTYRRFMRALARRCCLVRFDKLGTGLSDPVSAVPGMAERVVEAVAVMDAAHLEAPAVMGFSEGGPIAVQLAATHPTRVGALVLYGTFARNPPEAVLRQLAALGERWGSGETFDLFAPGARSASARQLAGAIERASASPAMYRALVASLAHTEVRALLPRIAVPTLVLHRAQEFIPVDEARSVAGAIPNARLVVLEGADHHPWAGNWRAVIEEITGFLAEVLPSTRKSRRMRPARMTHVRALSGWPSVTKAELAVIDLVAEGLSNAAIADRLVLSRYTVETHLKHVFAKLDVASRSELAAQAAQRR